MDNNTELQKFYEVCRALEKGEIRVAEKKMENGL